MKKSFALLMFAVLLTACTQDAVTPFFYVNYQEDPIQFGHTVYFDYAPQNMDLANSFAYAPEGWTVTLDQQQVCLTAPASLKNNAAENGVVLIMACYNGKMCSFQFPVSVYGIQIEGAETTQIIRFGKEKTYPYMAGSANTLDVTAPKGWTVTVDDQNIRVQAPQQAGADIEEAGIVTLSAQVYKDMMAQTSFNVSVYELLTEDFESFNGSEYMANSPYGGNYYGAIRYWESEVSNLCSTINGGDYGQAFYSGGVAISQYNDMQTAGYTNQMSAYYQDPVTGLGGHNGSKVFGVHYGNNNTTFGFDSRSLITFVDPTTTVFEKVYISLNTYAYLSLLKGDNFAHPATYEKKDWFLVTFQGIDEEGEETGTSASCYLADFRTATSPGIITGWQELDLRPLGKVSGFKIDIQATDDNGYGTAYPVYVCIDDITFRTY